MTKEEMFFAWSEEHPNNRYRDDTAEMNRIVRYPTEMKRAQKTRDSFPDLEDAQDWAEFVAICEKIVAEATPDTSYEVFMRLIQANIDAGTIGGVARDIHALRQSFGGEHWS